MAILKRHKKIDTQPVAPKCIILCVFLLAERKNVPEVDPEDVGVTNKVQEVRSHRFNNSNAEQFIYDVGC